MGRLFDRIPRRVLHREPMLFRNPFPLIFYGSDRYAANLASVGGPLRSISVLVKNCLQLISEPSVARLCRCRHNPPSGLKLRFAFSFS